MILCALFLMIFGRFFPAIGGLNASSMQVLSIFLGTLILWMNISIDWPSLLCLAALSFVPEMSMNQILASSIGSSTFAFLMFTFMCTYALSQTTFISRVALYFLNTKFARKGGWHFIIFYFLSVLCLGSIISPTVLVVVLIALSEEIFNLLGLKKKDPVASMMMMGMVFSSGLAAGMTPIAHVFPLMAMSFYQNATGATIGYLNYMMVGIPVVLLCFILMIAMFYFLYKPNVDQLKNIEVSSLQKALPPFTKREIYIISIFACVVALWVLPEFIKPVFPSVYQWINSFGTAMPPLLGLLAMSMITVEDKPLLDFKEGMSKGIPWASLIMVAGTLTLASALTNEKIGLITWITQQITPLLQGLSPLLLVFVFLLWASIQTNLSSNMVTVTVVCSVAIPATLSLAHINSAALALLIGMVASFAFATPPAMATIAFVLGSGWTTTKEVAKYGLILMVLTTIVASFIGYPLANMIL